VRIVVLAVAIVFIGGLATLTARDLSIHGVTFVGAAGVVVVVVVGVGVIGALLQPPRK
jgi:hypothetical protein